MGEMGGSFRWLEKGVLFCFWREKNWPNGPTSNFVLLI